MSVDDAKNRILSKVTLADVIGDTVNLTERGGRPVGCCPFHAEKTPSFVIYDDRYHCFGCKENGDAIEFVRKTQGLSFIESLKFLASRFGVEAPELEKSSQDLASQKRQASQYSMMLAAQKFYAEELQSPRGQEARRYLNERGFSDENIVTFGFGLTPPEGYGLIRALRRQNYGEDQMVECGLATMSSRDNSKYDFFRGRLMIPIREPQGRVIAFGGRTMDGHKAKYINSRDSKMYDKSRTLFGFDRARTTIREKGRAIVVEGYMDTLQLWQQGFGETTACLGTALTEFHLRLLRNATTKVYLLFDGDSAGRNATLSSVNVALSVPEVQVKAVVLPGNMDPDDFVRKNGPDALEKALEEGEDLLDFAIKERLQSTHQMAIPQLLTKEIIPWLSKVPDQLQKSYLISRVSSLTGVPKSEIQLLVNPVRRQNSDRNQTEVAPLREIESINNETRPLTRTERELFGHLYFSNSGEIDVELVRTFCFQDLDLDELWQNFLNEMLTCLADGQSPSEQPHHHWTASLSASVGDLLARLKKASGAFLNSNRAEAFRRLVEDHRAKKTGATVRHLKEELSRLVSTPGMDQEVRVILQQISDITRERPSALE